MCSRPGLEIISHTKHLEEKKNNFLIQNCLIKNVCMGKAGEAPNASEKVPKAAWIWGISWSSFLILNKDITVSNTIILTKM